MFMASGLGPEKYLYSVVGCWVKSGLLDMRPFYSVRFAKLYTPTVLRHGALKPEAHKPKTPKPLQPYLLRPLTLQEDRRPEASIAGTIALVIMITVLVVIPIVLLFLL